MIIVGIVSFIVIMIIICTIRKNNRNKIETEDKSLIEYDNTEESSQDSLSYNEKKETEFIKYYCEKCGSTLNYQNGFSPKLPFFKCRKCGTYCAGDNLKNNNGSIWFCYKCNTLLNNQEGFDPKKETHKCKKCGCINDIAKKNSYNKRSKRKDFTAAFVDTMNDINNIAVEYGFKNGNEWALYAHKHNEISYGTYKKYKSCHQLRNRIAHGNARDISISYETYNWIQNYEHDIKKSYLRCYH